MEPIREGGRLWKLVNYAILQGAWFGCVLGAAAGALWVAWLSGAAALALHFALLRDRRPDWIVIGAALAVGAVTDTIVRGVGAFDAPSDPWRAPLPVSWLLLLWAVFGTSIRHCMGWLRGRLVVAAALGAVGGPLSLMGGARFGAVTLSSDARLVWVAVGLQWAVALPLLVFVGDRATSPSSRPAR